MYIFQDSSVFYCLHIWEIEADQSKLDNDFILVWDEIDDDYIHSCAIEGNELQDEIYHYLNSLFIEKLKSLPSPEEKNSFLQYHYEKFPHEKRLFLIVLDNILYALKYRLLQGLRDQSMPQDEDNSTVSMNIHSNEIIIATLSAFLGANSAK